MIYGHGNETYHSSSEIKADFSSNIWYKGVTDELFTVLSQHMDNIGNYPEPDAHSLKNRIASYFNLKEENVTVSNGSTEAFYLLAQVFAGKESVVIYPGFAEYYDACQMHRHQISLVKNSSGWQVLSFENRIVWFANPNNPDGKTVTLAEIASLLKNNPSAVFILDEAYIELSYIAETAVPLLFEYPNLVIVRSFTKAFSIPGLRLGFVLASKRITDKIRSFLMPWNVNSLAQAAGIYIMENYDRLQPDKETIRRESTEFQKEVGKIKKLKVHPSGCNFFLAESLTKPAFELKKFLILEHGILIRDASNFRGLDKHFFRVAVQKPEMNKLLIKGIRNWLQL